MNAYWRLKMATVAGLCAGAALVSGRLLAAEAAPRTFAARTTVATRPSAPAMPTISVDHPLTDVISYAKQEEAYIRQAIRDFTCRLVKRERIDGLLQDHQYIDMRVRQHRVEDGSVVQPLNVFLEFAGPKKLVGRRVLYIEGANEGKMLARNGGRRFDYVVAHVDPAGENAMRESLVPITQSDFSHILRQMIVVLERHARLDPEGQNTKAERIDGAKINGRSCGLIRITHPHKMDGLEFHTANVYVDDELRVPVRVDFSSWSRGPKFPAPLLAEYTYTNLKLNVGLEDAAFSPKRLREK